MTVRPGILTLTDLIAGITGRQMPPESVPPIEVHSAVIDSRLATPGCLFIALPGERNDGHDFVPDAVARGAAAVIAQRAPSMVNGLVLDLSDDSLQVGEWKEGNPICLIVPDSLVALQRAAAHWRRQHDVTVIAITGSVGKTTAKEAIASVERQRYRILKSEGNYNNEIGLPLTLLHLTGIHQRVALEMGMYDLREIAHLCDIALPLIGAVTNVGPSHLERLGTIERIAQAKAELPAALPPAGKGGIAILNADDKWVRSMADQTTARVLTYGLTPTADLWADEIESKGLEGIRFRFHYGRETIYVRVPMLGRHSVHTALCAAAVGLAEELSWEEIIAGLHDQSAQLRLVAVSGPSDSTILDDTYNASPMSCVATLNLLAEVDGRKIAVLGDMLELGRYTEEGHKIVGRRARDVVDILITVGRLARLIGEEALQVGMDIGSVYCLDTNTEALDLLRVLIKPGPVGDKILIKGSRGMEMEAIVAALQKGDLL
jgi:UDP-N-acetylmuramoyl-tripeptide--D-alanyl-D-alanine ligase